jgi:hypothetical protein
MSTIKLYIILTGLSVLLFTLLQPNGYSQGTDIRAGEQKHLYLGFNFSPAQNSLIYNDINDSIADIKSTKKNSLSGELEIGYQFSKYFGFSTGIGLRTYSGSIALPMYSNSYNTTDSEGDNYLRKIKGSNINEVQKISTLNIPVKISLQLPLNKKSGLFLQTGVNFLLSVNNKYSSTGTFSYSGYYPLFDVIISDVDHENFKSEQQIDVNGKLEVKSFIPEWNSSAGFYYSVSNKIQISLGFFYGRILSNISSTSTVNSFQLSSDPNQMNSMMDGSSNVTAQAMGLKLGIRYYLK